MSAVVRPFRPADRDGVVAMIVAIQRDEFGIPIKVEDQPDLQDVPGFYQSDAGGFWVAEHGGQIVGSIALKDIGNGEGALRKMFVARDHRGGESRIAARLLETLERFARDKGLRALYLGTTDKFLAAHRFYEKSGFSRIAPEHLPAAFPRMAVDTVFYSKAL